MSRSGITAKSYLQQIAVLDVKIANRRREADMLVHAIISPGRSDTTTDRVQQDPEDIADRLGKHEAMLRDIEKLIADMVKTRHELIAEIHSLQCGEATAKYIDILFKRYVELKDFKTISEEMCYEYKWTCHMHGYALKEFTRQVLQHEQTRINKC